LKALESGESVPADVPAALEAPATTMTVKQAFSKKDKVFCLLCGKSFTTLKRHLTVAHGLKAGEYRKPFGIKSSQSLAAKSYVESRRQTAISNNLSDGLAKARAARAANKKVTTPAIEKTKKAASVAKEAVLSAKASKTKSPAAVKAEVAKAPAKKKVVAPAKAPAKKTPVATKAPKAAAKKK
jgi:predicted transcriptional regulator